MRVDADAVHRRPGDGIEEAGNRLTGLKVTGSDGVTRVVPLDMLLVFFGLSPKLGPIADWA